MKLVMMAAVLMFGFAAQGYAATEGCAYEVPVPAELDAYKCFDVRYTHYRQKNDGRLELRYSLPDLLVGEGGQSIRLDGVFDATKAKQVLKGDDGYAECALGASGLIDCLVEYKRLRNDEASAEALLNKMPISDEDKNQIRGVRMHFHHQSMGIIRGPLED